MAVLSCSGNEPTPTPTPSDSRTLKIQEMVEIAHDTEEFSVTVNANFTFSVESQVDWLDYDRTEGDQVYFTAEPNVYTTDREGKVKVSDVNDRDRKSVV